MIIAFLFQFIIVVGVAVLLFHQVIYQVYQSKPIFPMFRKKKASDVKKEEEPMTAERALELVNFHSEKALHFISVAESYAENEEKEAQEKLEKAHSTLETVKDRVEKVKNIQPEEGVK